MIDYTSLKIVREAQFSWVYYPNGGTAGFGVSKGYFSWEDSTGKLQIVENGKSLRPKVALENISFEDQYLGTPIVYFTNFTNFQNLMTLKGCPLSVDVVSNTEIALPLYNRFNQVTGFSIVDNDLTINANWKWTIEGDLNTNPTSLLYTVAFSTPGKHRIDVVVANTSNSFTIIPGTEVDLIDTPVKPPIPINTLEVTFLLVSDGEIIDGGDPIVGYPYVEKEEFVEKIITGTGLLSIPLIDKNTSYRITSDDIETIESLDPSDDYKNTIAYIGKIHHFINDSNVSIVFPHTSLEWGFRLPNEVDLILAPKETVTFRETKSSNIHLSLVSHGRIIIVVNSLEELVEGRALDATQGKILKDYIDNVVTGLWDDRGPHDASTNLFPSTGGSGTSGAILKGDIWTVSAPGTLGSEVVEIGDTVRALVNAPGTTATNWAIQQNNIGYVPENVVNKVTDIEANKANAGKYGDIPSWITWLKDFFISNLTAKSTSLVDADKIIIGDSEDSNKTKTRTWAQIKATLYTYFSTLFKPQSSSVTTLTVSFTTENIHYTDSAPGTGNVLVDLTGAKRGLIQKMYHNSGTAPTFPAGFVKKGSGNYQASVLNEIYFEWAGGSRVEYWIIKY